MDLERENSGLESVSDNEALANSGNLESGDDILSKVENNGSHATEHVSVGTVKDAELENLMPVMVGRSSDSGSPLVSPGKTAKGKGLRKWRRIKRDATTEGNLNFDNSRLLKRGLSNVGGQPGKTTQFSSELRRMSEGSVSSNNEVVRSPGVLLDGLGMMDNLGLAMAPVFEAEGESEVRDDRPVIAGHINNRNRAKSSGEKISNGSAPKVQQGKTTGGRSKKLRGQVTSEKEKSQTSMKSESQSSNVVSMQDNNYVTTRGRQNGGLTKYAGKTDQAHRRGNGRFQTRYGTKSGTEFEDVSQRKMSAGLCEGVEEENKEMHESSTDQDPLIESIHMLQSVQEALEKEVQSFKDIGYDDILVNESIPSEWNSEENDQSSSGENDSRHYTQALESEILTLKDNASLMKSSLKEITALLKAREADVCEMEAILDIEAEIESIYRQKIEAEVNYLTISKTIQHLRVASMEKISILEQQTASEKSQILNNLGYVESKAEELKQEAKKLESYSEDRCRNETLKLQSNICKYTFCFLLQLILFIVILGFLVSQLSPHSIEVVPT